MFTTITAIALTALALGAGPNDLVDTFIKWFLDVAPLLAALGLFHIAASLGRGLWAKLKDGAAKSPTKIDDFLVHIADPPITLALDLLDKGDVEGARKKLEALKSLVPKR